MPFFTLSLCIFHCRFLHFHFAINTLVFSPNINLRKVKKVPYSSEIPREVGYDSEY